MFERPNKKLQNLLKKSQYLLVFDGIMGLVVVSDNLVWVGVEHHPLSAVPPGSVPGHL